MTVVKPMLGNSSLYSSADPEVTAQLKEGQGRARKRIQSQIKADMANPSHGSCCPGPLIGNGFAMVYLLGVGGGSDSQPTVQNLDLITQLIIFHEHPPRHGSMPGTTDAESDR